MSNAPIGSKRLGKRKTVSGTRRGTTCDVTLANAIVRKGDQIFIERDTDDKNLMKIKCRASIDGLRAKRRIPVKGIKLNADIAKKHLKVKELDGLIPKGLDPNFTPQKAKRTPIQKHLDGTQETEKPMVDPDTGERLDQGGTIFGTDDRFLFNDQSFPWRTTGLIRTAGGRCSGTTIGPRLVLTASHCVNWDGDGGAGWITFTPGYFDGNEPWGEIAATNVIYWLQAPGTLNDQQTAFDYVVLVMEEDIGDVVGYPGYRTYDEAWNDGSFWQYTGYPGELAGGERPAFQGDCVISSAQTQSLNSNSALVLGHFNEFTPGQSGGAAWGWWDDEPWPRVVGVGSTIGSTAVQRPTGSTNGDNEYGGGAALSALISWARENFPSGVPA